jgi:hypothetical protein
MPVHVYADDPAQSPAAALALTRQRGDRHLVFHKGDYFDVDLRLGPEDVGMVLEAAPGESPVLYGGCRIGGWQPDGDRFWAAPVPGVREGMWDFRTLMVDGHPAARARLPQAGMFTHESRFDGHWMSSSAGGWDRNPTEGELTTLRYAPGDLGDWLDVRNAECTVYHQWDESLVGVKAHDSSTRTLTFSTPCTHPPGSFGVNPRALCFVLWNVREGMHEPGQWYLDRTRGLLVYWPRPGEDMRTLFVIAPTRFSIIQCEGTEGQPVKDVVIRGLTLASTTTPLRSAGFGAGNLEGAITLKGPSENVLIERVRIHNAGGQGIHVDRGGRRVRIAGSVIEDCGGPGIFAVGEGCVIADNVVRRIGLVYPSAVALSLTGTDGDISHNEVSGCPYTAIHSGGRGMRIEFNILRDFMKELDDGGAIYSFAAKHCIYRGNAAYGTSGRLAHAYYLDEQSEDSVVEENLAVNTRSPCHNHMARNCVIRRNTFIDDGPSAVLLMRCEGFTFEDNLWVGGGGLTLTMPRQGLKRTSGNRLYPGTGAIRVGWLKDGGYEVEKTEDWPPGTGEARIGPRPTR